MRARPLLCAHRGGAALGPENTLVACRRSLELGVDAVEVDVRWTQDRVAVLLHDERVDRTTDGRGEVRALTWAQLRELDAGGWFDSAHRGERVPSLAELVQLLELHAGVLLFLEVKEQGEEGATLAEAALALAEDVGLGHRLTVISFHPDPLLRVKAMRPEVPTVALQAAGSVTDPVRFVRDRGAEGWGPHHAALTEETLRRVHQEGLFAFVWTVNEPGRARELVALGLGSHPGDVLVTDAPHRVREALRGGEG